jgi:WD40 repeat protein
MDEEQNRNAEQKIEKNNQEFPRKTKDSRDLEIDFFNLDSFSKFKSQNPILENIIEFRKTKHFNFEGIQKKYVDFHKKCILENSLFELKFKDKVYAMDFSPCGNYLALCSIDGILIIYSIPGFDVKQSVHIQTEGIYTLRYSPDCKYIAFGGDDLKVVVIDAETLQHVHSFLGHSGCIQDLKWIRTDQELYLISVSMDASMRVWNINTKKLDYFFSDHASDINTVEITADQSYILTGSDDTSINIYNQWNWDLGSILKPHLGPIYSISASVDGLIASSSIDGTVALYSQEDWRLLKTLMFRENIIKKVQWSPFGELLIVCVYGQIYAVSLSTFEIVIAFREHSKQTISCCWHPSGKYLVSSDQDYNVIIWKNPLYIIQGPIEDFKPFNIPDISKLTKNDAIESITLEFNTYTQLLEKSKREILDKFEEKLRIFKFSDALADRVLTFYKENVNQEYAYYKRDASLKYEEMMKKLREKEKD